MKTAERTIERPRVERVVEQPARRRSGVTLVAALVALVLGFVGGYLLRGSDDVDPTAPVAVDGAELTARQQQMVEMVDDYVAAWQQGDGEAAESLFTENGRFIRLGTVRTASDGGIAGYVDSLPTPTLTMMEPALINGSTLVNFHPYQGDDYTNVITFTTTGDLLIVRHEMVG